MSPIPFNTRTPPGVQIQLPVDRPVPIKIRARVSNLPKGREGFLMWLQHFSPNASEKLLTMAPHIYDLNNQLEAHLGGVDDVGPPTPTAAAAPVVKDWTTTVKNVLGGILSVYQQKKMVDLQLERAKSGKSPLDLSAYTDDTSLKVGLDRSTKQAALGVGSMAMIAVLGFAFLMFKRNRR